MGTEQSCPVCQSPLVASEGNSEREPVCPQCQVGAAGRESMENPVRPEGRPPDVSPPPARASAETLRLDVGPTDDTPYQMLAEVRVPGPHNSDDSSDVRSGRIAGIQVG